MADDQKDKDHTDEHIAVFRRLIESIAKDTGVEIDESDRLSFRLEMKWKLAKGVWRQDVWYVDFDGRYIQTIEQPNIYRGKEWLVVILRDAIRSSTTMLFRIRNEDSTIPTRLEYMARRQRSNP
jgi:hypothetical protein